MDWPVPISITEDEIGFEKLIRNEDVRYLLRTISPASDQLSMFHRLKHLTRINIHLADPLVSIMWEGGGILPS